MAVSDWSTTPASNTYLGTFNLQEGATLVGDYNGITRQIMADVRTFYNGVPVAADYVPKSGGVFTTRPTLTGQGGFLSWSNSALTGGRIYLQTQGSGTPAGMSPGDILMEYA